MKEDGIIFVKSLLKKLEDNIISLENAKANNEPREFGKLKETSLKLHKEIEGLLQ